MTRWQRYLFGFGRVVVAGYWLWLLRAVLAPGGGTFETLLVHTSGLVVSLHTLQLLVFTRFLRSQGRYWHHLVLTLLFGAMYVVPLLLERSGRMRRAA